MGRARVSSTACRIRYARACVAANIHPVGSTATRCRCIHVKNLHALAAMSVAFTILMIATAESFPRGRVVELSTPTDIYRLSRSAAVPVSVLAYAGEAGAELRTTLAQRAPLVPDGLFLALELESMLEHIPPELFRDTPMPELEGAGMETIAFAVNRAGTRMRWTTVAGPEAQALLADPIAQADAIINFIRS